ncbi:hypothetical protein VTK26DRAFT_1699 [Humicola hyalothermophila]
MGGASRRKSGQDSGPPAQPLAFLFFRQRATADAVDKLLHVLHWRLVYILLWWLRRNRIGTGIEVDFTVVKRRIGGGGGGARGKCSNVILCFSRLLFCHQQRTYMWRSVSPGRDVAPSHGRSIFSSHFEGPGCCRSGVAGHSSSFPFGETK